MSSPATTSTARRLAVVLGLLVAVLAGLLAPASGASARVVCPRPGGVAPGAAEVARHGIPAACYQGVFTAIVGSGYRLAWVDGYSVDGATYYNAIFRPPNGIAWKSFHGLTSAQYQSVFNTLPAGWRPIQVDAYESGGSVVYAGIWAKQGGPAWIAYHGLTAVQHQARFDALTAAGWRAVNISVANTGLVDSYTGFYVLANVGSYYVKSDLTPAQYQAFFDWNWSQGRRLVYVNGHSHNGSSRISAIWWQAAASGPARHNLTSSQYQSAWTTFVAGSGLRTRAVAGYASGLSARYVAFWTP